MKNRTLFHWIIFVSLALTWGSSFILMKRGLDSFSSYQVAALRIFIAFLFLRPLAFRHIKKNHFKYLPAFIAMGVFGNLIPAFLFTQAETLISSALTGMLNSVTPVFALIIGLIMLKEKVKLLQIVGLATGIIGAIGLLSLGKNSESSGNIYLGGAMVLLATFFYGLSVNIIKAKLGNVSAVTATIFALCIVGPFAGIYLFTTDFIEVMQTKPLAFDSLKYVCILAIFGTSLSLIVFNILIKEAGTLFASSVTYFIPIVAMLWGALDGEAITVAHSIFIVVILAGVWLVNKK